MPTRTLILEIEADKYDGFVKALAARPHIQVISMEREARKNLVNCPCCDRKLSKESTFTINEDMVDALTRIVQKMSIAKTVIIVNKENPASLVPPIEAERCVELSPLMVFRAQALALIAPFLDGSRPTYFVTSAGLSFLSGEAPASPCSITTLDDEIVETGGVVAIDAVKFKDSMRSTAAIRLASMAVEALPASVANFVTNGQMNLI